MESLATREPCVPPTDAGMLFALFNLTIQLEGDARFFQKDTYRILGRKQALHTYNDTHTEYWRSMKFGMLCRFIWSIMHKSTCFNFMQEAKKEQPTHRQFLSIHLSRFDQIVALFLCVVYSIFSLSLFKVMPFYCCCSMNIFAHDVWNVCIWCTKMARKNVRAKSTNFFTLKSYSHALFQSHSSTRFILYRSDSLSPTQYTHREQPNVIDTNTAAAQLYIIDTTQQTKKQRRI